VAVANVRGVEILHHRFEGIEAVAWVAIATSLLCATLEAKLETTSARHVVATDLLVHVGVTVSTLLVACSLRRLRKQSKLHAFARTRSFVLLSSAKQAVTFRTNGALQLLALLFLPPENVRTVWRRAASELLGVRQKEAAQRLFEETIPSLFLAQFLQVVVRNRAATRAGTADGEFQVREFQVHKVLQAITVVRVAAGKRESGARMGPTNLAPRREEPVVFGVGFGATIEAKTGAHGCV